MNQYDRVAWASKVFYQTSQVSMKKTLWLSAALAALSTLASPAHAVQVTYSLSPAAGEKYRYTYTVNNDGSTGGAVKLFDIFFDPLSYDEASLTIATGDPTATGWDQLILASGIALPAAYDAFSLSGGIPIFGSEAGFAVEFAWLGAGMPGPQNFSIYDSLTFDLLETGSTTAVPAPAAHSLLAGALLCLTGILRRRQRENGWPNQGARA